MKALVISDRPEIIDFVTPLLKDKGFDLIHYRWIIKALDNIEEIQPDVIVLSAGEYSRHWKTLAGFVQSGIGGNDVKVYLYETSPLSEEDEKKAQSLGVLYFVDHFKKEEAKESDEPVLTVSDSPSFVNVELAYNDEDGKIHFCNGRYCEGKQELEIEANLTNGSYLKYISLFDGNDVKALSARVEAVSDGITSLKVE